MVTALSSATWAASNSPLQKCALASSICCCNTLSPPLGSTLVCAATLFISEAMSVGLSVNSCLPSGRLRNSLAPACSVTTNLMPSPSMPSHHSFSHSSNSDASPMRCGDSRMNTFRPRIGENMS